MLFKLDLFFKVGLFLTRKFRKEKKLFKFFLGYSRQVYICNFIFLRKKLIFAKKILYTILQNKGLLLFISLDIRFDSLVKIQAKSCFQGALLSNTYIPGFFSNHKNYKISGKYFYKVKLKYPSLVFLIYIELCKVHLNLVKELLCLGIPFLGVFDKKIIKDLLRVAVHSYDGVLTFFFCSFMTRALLQLN